jgi:hypothetical protein
MIRHTIILTLLIAVVCLSNFVVAREVKILAVEFQNSKSNIWFVQVTLQHEDSGWDHYADKWRIVDKDGKVLGERILLHPHVEEQPFTRSLDNVMIPESITTVFIEAHDKVHGWTAQRCKVDINSAKQNGRLRIEVK